LVNAIEQALSDQTIEYYQQGKAPKKAGTIDKSSGDLTNVDKVLNALKIKGVADKETLMMMTDLSKKELDPILYDYTDKIKNVKKGFGIFALKDHNCTKEEVEQYLPQSYLKRQNRPVLEMPSS
jgi:hypothetical protein